MISQRSSKAGGSGESELAVQMKRRGESEIGREM